MNYTEHALAFRCAGEQLVGILAQPETAANLGILIVVGGPQYRAGSHRQFLLLSRVLAAAGYAVLRFDYRGMGDSTGGQRNFEGVSEDIAAAIAAMQSANPTLTRIVLWGLCDAASAALLYWDETRDRRVAGLCLLNPWVRSETTLARTQVKHYYGRRLLQPEFWAKLFSGKVALGAVTGFVRNLSVSARGATDQRGFQRRMADAWRSFGEPIMLVLSGDDYTAKEFLEYASSDSAWRAALQQPNVKRHDLPAADHTFSRAEWRAAVERWSLAWLAESFR